MDNGGKIAGNLIKATIKILWMDEQMKIAITRSNPVEPDTRVEKEAYTLTKNGYEVEIIAWDRRTDETYKKEKKQVYGLEAEIIRLGARATYGEGRKNLKAFIKFQYRLFRCLVKNRKAIEIIHACDFDTAFTASIYAGLFHKKLVFDIFDFICGENKSIYQKVIRKLQYHIINRADATVICSEKRKLQIKGSRPKKLIVIHNTPIKDAPIEIENRDKNANQKIKIAYVGILSKDRLLKEMAEVISGMKEVELHIAGFGLYEEYIEMMAERHPNIKYYGKIPYERTLELEKECDILTAIYNPEIENHYYAAPNKFYEGLMLGKPLLMVKNTGMSELLEQYDLGSIIEYSKEGFRKGLIELIDRKQEWGEIGMRMKEIYQKNYGWEIMEARLTELYASLSGYLCAFMETERTVGSLRKVGGGELPNLCMDNRRTRDITEKEKGDCESYLPYQKEDGNDG